MLVMTVGVQNLFGDHIDLLVGIAFGHNSWLLWRLMQVESATAPHRVNKPWPVSGFIYCILLFPLFEFCSLPSIKMVCS
ncbi:unnamed protein product [Musa acuminata var. zebrina]